MTTDMLLLAADDGHGGMLGYRIAVPEHLTREDLYIHLLADIPAGEPQPVALNLPRRVPNHG